MFGIYDYTNDRMLTHCYQQQKKSNQFIDFIERVDSFYDLNIKRIFLVLDNASIHKSKKTKEALSKHHPRITLVFLPTTKSPRLNNVIEVRWMWLQRKAIDNSTFRNQSDIGQTVQDWTENYNATHGRRINDILQIGVMPLLT